jgi:hypothetical protein
MADIDINVDGLQDAVKLINTGLFAPAVKHALAIAAKKLRAASQGHTPVYFPQKGEKRSGGNLQYSWTEPTEAGPMAYTFQNPASYAGIVEEGLWRASQVVGTRRDGTPGLLIHGGGGKVWSTRAVGGIVGPLVAPERLREYATLIAVQISQQLGLGQVS